MRKVDRQEVDKPTVLEAAYGRPPRTEFDRVVTHRKAKKDNPKLKSYEFSRFKQPDVKEKLEELFHGKCAYCESYFSKTQPVDVEHFRPKGAIEDDADHGGYWWLAWDWENLLPSCIDCNRKRKQVTPDANATLLEEIHQADIDRTQSIVSGKGTTFPLKAGADRAQFKEQSANPIETAKAAVAAEDEARLLLDPTLDNPRDHLLFSVDKLSVVGPKKTGQAARKAVTSIQVYGLNRLALVQARTKLLRDLDFLLKTYIDIGEVNKEIRSKLVKPKSQQLDEEPNNSTLKAELASCKGIVSKLVSLRKKILSNLKSKAAAEEPYSELVFAWLQDRT